MIKKAIHSARGGDFGIFMICFAPLRLCENQNSRKGAKAQVLFVLFIFCTVLMNAQNRRQTAIDFTDKGLEYYAHDSIDKAIQMFDIAVKEDSNYEEARYRRANSYYDKKDFKSASMDYLWLINHHTHTADVYERLGDMDTAIQDFKNALPFFSAAIAIDSSQGSYFAARGLSWFNLEKFDKAATDLEKAVQLNYASADIYSRLGYAKLRMEDNKSAAFYFTKAIELNPGNYEDYANRGDALVGMHSLIAAKEDLLYYMKFDSLDYSVWHNLARAEYGLMEYDAAIKAYKRVLKLKPGYGDTWFRLGLVYADKQDYKNAIEAFNQAISQDPANAYLYYNRAVAKAKLNNGSDYCTDLKKAADMGYELAEKMRKEACK